MKNRNKLTIPFLAALLLAPLAAVTADTPFFAGFRVSDLKTDYRENPLGLESRHLRFFWRVNGGDQAACQVQVASSPEQLATGKADLWDSGKRDGAATIQIAYEGKAPSSRQRVWWRVRAWDKAGKQSPWSAPAWFEMALLNDADWRDAQWIGCNRDYEVPESASAELMGSWIAAQDAKAVDGFFKDIVLPDKPVVSAMTWWGLSKPAGRAGVVVNYEELGFYTTQDITGLLKPGANALAVLLDAGWYHEVGGFGSVFSYGRPGLKALVVLDYADGKTEWFTSGPGWRWKEGAIRSANLYRGEQEGKPATEPPAAKSGPTQFAGDTVPKKELPLPGDVFLVAGRAAFIIPAKAAPATKAKPWVWYAPTLPRLPNNSERWMFEKFRDAGIAVAGIDVGESFGSPAGRKLYSALYTEMSGPRGYSHKPVMLGRSRGGLMALSWAAENPDKVAGFAGIYPVCNIASYPGVAKAAPAYEMKSEELQTRLAEHNPVDHLAPLAKAGVPLFAIHGDSDKMVPLDANSALLKTRYSALGGSMQLIVPPGQGHNIWTGFFQCEELVNFVKSHSKP